MDLNLLSADAVWRAETLYLKVVRTLRAGKRRLTGGRLPKMDVVNASL